MSNIARRAGAAALALAALAAATTGPASAAPPEGVFRVTNDAQRVVECNFMVAGKTRTYLKVHQGKAYFAAFDPRTLLQLACVRGEKEVYGPLKVGVEYRFVDRAGNRVAVVEGPAAE
jgi:hypothetical protein